MSLDLWFSPKSAPNWSILAQITGQVSQKQFWWTILKSSVKIIDQHRQPRHLGIFQEKNWHLKFKIDWRTYMFWRYLSDSLLNFLNMFLKASLKTSFSQKLILCLFHAQNQKFLTKSCFCMPFGCIFWCWQLIFEEVHRSTNFNWCRK